MINRRIDIFHGNKISFLISSHWHYSSSTVRLLIVGFWSMNQQYRVRVITFDFSIKIPSQFFIVFFSFPPPTLFFSLIWKWGLFYRANSCFSHLNMTRVDNFSVWNFQEKNHSLLIKPTTFPPFVYFFIFFIVEFLFESKMWKIDAIFSTFHSFYCILLVDCMVCIYMRVI